MFLINNRNTLLWITSLLLIPLFSVYGRAIQYTLQENFSRLQLSILISVILLILCGIAVYLSVKKRSHHQLWHLLWFLPLFLVLPLFISIPEEKAHFIVFGVFGFLTMLRFSPRTAFSLCVSVSILDEGLQWYLPDRVGDLFDVAMNMLASISGALYSKVAIKGK